VQFGIPRDLSLRRRFMGATIGDDPSLGLPIAKGVVSFAGGGPRTRDAQLFIPFEHLDFLGKEPWEVRSALAGRGVTAFYLFFSLSLSLCARVNVSLMQLYRLEEATVSVDPALPLPALLPPRRRCPSAAWCTAPHP